MSALACAECGAGLPPPNEIGTSFCVYCGTEHHDRASATFASSLAHRPSWIAPEELEQDPALAGEQAARIPMTEDAVLTIVREHFAPAFSVSVCPHIVPKREQAFRTVHAVHLPERERILALFDATPFGSGEEGFVITAKRICWKNPGELANAIEWCDVESDVISPEPPRLFLGNESILIDDEAALDACADVFHLLALSSTIPQPGLSGRILATLSNVPDYYGEFAETGERLIVRGESHYPDFSGTAEYGTAFLSGALAKPDCTCWHCRTPLYNDTPQCTYCGAFPSEHGWLRTG